MAAMAGTEDLLTAEEHEQLASDIVSILNEAPSAMEFSSDPLSENAPAKTRGYASMRRQFHNAVGLDHAYPEVMEAMVEYDKARLLAVAQSKGRKKRTWTDEVLMSDSSDEENGNGPITEADYLDMRKQHKRKRLWQARAAADNKMAKYRLNCNPFQDTVDLCMPKQLQVQQEAAGLVPSTDTKGLKLVSEERTDVWVPVHVPKVKARVVKLKQTSKGKAPIERSPTPVKRRRKTAAQLEDNFPEIPLVPKRKFEKASGMSEQQVKEEIAQLEAEIAQKLSSAMPSPPKKTLETIAEEQNRLWAVINQRDVVKAHKYYTAGVTNRMAAAKRVAELCQKKVKKQEMESQRRCREKTRQCRRLLSEMMTFWRKNEKIERENRKREEKARLEQRKREEEERELRRQQRKFNFLITQTELYAHFMANKMTKAGDDELVKGQEAILSKLKSTPAANGDEEEETDEMLQQRALNHAQNAMAKQQQQVNKFDSVRQADKDNVELKGDAQDHFDHSFSLAEPTLGPEAEFAQPAMLNATLKSYQLKGVNWLANLYTQGINGILADEMGLGKTIQSISTLAHLAESENIWGPFLIVSPASTLHNWYQEFQKFVPEFKVLPYWGNQQDRSILRKFWDPKKLYCKDASFHVLVTSYQMVVQDEKYFNRIQWQYMILDEAQAIKSSSSARWNTLLKFPCRNRLLLTGTPIQNTMAELWALLHFIMPTLFDSHNEFNEWFSKDIESHTQDSKTSKLTQGQLARLHMILKPFMLRRIKRDVEHELVDKIEIQLDCSLSVRQKKMYKELKRNISLKDIARSDKPSNLMNIVMQFRKVCNHPNLWVQQDTVSPFAFEAPRWGQEARSTAISYTAVNAIEYNVPVIIYETVVRTEPSEFALPLNWQRYWALKNGIFAPDAIRDSLQTKNSAFSFLGLADVSIEQVSSIARGTMLQQWLHHLFALHQSTQRSPFAEHAVPAWRLLNVVSSTEHASLEPGLLFTQDIIFSKRFSEAPPAHLKKFLWAFPRVSAAAIQMQTSNRSAEYDKERHCSGVGLELGTRCLFERPANLLSNVTTQPLAAQGAEYCPTGGLLGCQRPVKGWSFLQTPSMEQLIADCGKLMVLDRLLKKLQREGHRVLIYSQMTKMIDILEDYLGYRSIKFIRLDGSSKISDRRDMVSDFQTRDDIFAFLLSTRAGGLGITLTAADTVIFYDSDWNPTVDQQAMDRAHRLGQTKQVTVYRLITTGTVEEKILKRARQKSEIQQLVISGGEFAPSSDSLEQSEVVSLLLDDDDVANQLQEKREAEEKRRTLIGNKVRETKKQKREAAEQAANDAKRRKKEEADQ